MSTLKSLPDSVADLVPHRAPVRWWDVRARVRRFLAELDDLDHDDEADVVVETEARHDDHLVRCHLGQPVRLFGRVKKVVFHPGTAKLTEVTLHDGTGLVELVFNTGVRPKDVTAGVKLEVAGELTTYQGKHALINPDIVAVCEQHAPVKEGETNHG